MSESCKYFGQLVIQHDWHEAMRNNEKAWLSSVIEGQPSIYGELSPVSKAGGRELKTTDGFKAEYVGKNIKIKHHNTCSYFHHPLSTFSNIHTKAVRCLDVSPGGGLAISCDDDDGLFIWQTDNGNIRRSLDGHVSDVTHCRFFPSGVVALTGGVDMTLRIWSTEDGSCPVILTGHKGAITCTEIVDKGRNIISCSRDGSALLWDCGTSSCLNTLKTCDSAINCCCMIQYKMSVENQTSNRSESECGTNGKLLVIGREDGVLDAVDAFDRKTIFSYHCDSAVNSCCFVGDTSLAAGLNNGCINFFDLRNTKSPYKIRKYGKSSVNCLKEYHTDNLLVGRGDGTTSCISTKEDCESVTYELTGPDCDPIYSLSTHANCVYTACRDKRVRKYKLEINT